MRHTVPRGKAGLVELPRSITEPQADLGEARPPVRMSAVANPRASSAGFQNGTLTTSVPTRSRSVAAAAATTAWNGAASPR